MEGHVERKFNLSLDADEMEALSTLTQIASTRRDLTFIQGRVAEYVQELWQGSDLSGYEIRRGTPEEINRDGFDVKENQGGREEQKLENRPTQVMRKVTPLDVADKMKASDEWRKLHNPLMGDTPPPVDGGAEHRGYDIGSEWRERDGGPLDG